MAQRMITSGIGAAIAKGAIMSVVLFALGIDFWQQLIIASISALISGLFVVGAVIMTAYLARENRDQIRQARQEIDHVKRGLGLDKRSDDNKPPEV